MIRAAKNGCSTEFTFKGLKVYHDWDRDGIPKSTLGAERKKTEFLKTLVDDANLKAVENLMVDWYLYENGWYVPYNDGYKNEHLFYYLCQIHGYEYHRPKELEYFKKIPRQENTVLVVEDL